MQAFDERELELVIGGLGKIDLQDWKTNTRLKHCTVETPQVKNLFFKAYFEKCNHCSGCLVLEHCWLLQRGDEGEAAAIRHRQQQSSAPGFQGTPGLPIRNSGSYFYLLPSQGSTGAAGPRLFTLHLVDVDPGNLPKAHTCFNRCYISKF